LKIKVKRVYYEKRNYNHLHEVKLISSTLISNKFISEILTELSQNEREKLFETENFRLYLKSLYEKFSNG